MGIPPLNSIDCNYTICRYDPTINQGNACNQAMNYIMLTSAVVFRMKVEFKLIYVVWRLISGENGPRFVAHVVHERIVVVLAHSVQVFRRQFRADHQELLGYCQSSHRRIKSIIRFNGINWCQEIHTPQIKLKLVTLSLCF